MLEFQKIKNPPAGGLITDEIKFADFLAAWYFHYFLHFSYVLSIERRQVLSRATVNNLFILQNSKI